MVLTSILKFFLDAFIFIVLPFFVWKLLKKIVPLAVLSILTGIAFAGFDLSHTEWGIPSPIGDRIGWLGVLLLAFIAGMESQRPPLSQVGQQQRFAVRRVLASALFAIFLPFVVGALAANFYLLQLPGWAPAGNLVKLGAAAIGLCVAVSALPVLISIVRELPTEYRLFGKAAQGMALVDDAMLWLGLALLQLIALGHAGTRSWGTDEVIAAFSLVSLPIASHFFKPYPPPALGYVVLAAALYLTVCAWATAELGLHELIGAYFAGAIMPSKWLHNLPLEKYGQLSLVLLAPLFFGHSGLNIESNALNWTSVMAAIALLALSFSSKIAAIVLYPPLPSFSHRESFAVGVLLQCKGLMEIVAATILHKNGLLSANAYAALLMLAILSTALTGPVFRFLLRKR